MLARRRFLSELVAIPLTNLCFAQATSGVAKLTVNVRDFGATGNGAAKDTPAIQKALDRCGVLGGGEVLLPAGTYLSGAIALRSNTTLRLAEGAILSGTPDFAD